MEVDIKLLLQLGSVVVAIVGALAVAKQQLRSVIDTVSEINDRISKLATNLDKVENSGISFESEIRTRLNVVTHILSVERLEAQHRELEQLHAADKVAIYRLDRLRSDLAQFRDEYLSSHNNGHKYVPPPKALE
jgi:predicted  nucleic acid-binding Zn-ribbon protein